PRIASSPRPSITRRSRRSCTWVPRSRTAYCSLTRIAKARSVIAMNGISYGTSNRGMPRLEASSTSDFGSRWCSNPVPSPNPATPRSASPARKRRWRGAPVSWIPVVRSSSPPESQGVGSSSSEMCTQRIGRSAPSVPAASSRPQSLTRLPTVSISPWPSPLDPFRGLRQDRPQHALDLLELLGVTDQRRRQLNHRIAAIVGPADQAAAEELAGDEAAQQPLRLLVGEPLLGLLILDQLDRLEVAVAADIADDWDVAQRVEHRPKLALLATHVTAEVLTLEEVQVGHRHGRGHRMAREGEAVGEHVLALHERLGDLVGNDHAAHRHVRRRQRLGDGHYVGDVAVALAAEPVTEPAPGTDHLVGDQQDVVAVADLAHPLEVARLGRDAAAGVLAGLENHRGHGVGMLVEDPLLDLVRSPQ